MFLPSYLATRMALPFPDLSLQLSPPSAAESAADSGSNLSHGYSSSLSLGFETENLSCSQSLQIPLNAVYHHHYRLIQQHFQPKIYGRESTNNERAKSGVKRSNRAPRMKWTSTLHSQFVQAVHLLGGHERARPKSILELMNVKDLTLAQVKSHLQVYRCAKSTDHKGSDEDCTEMGLKQKGGIADFQVTYGGKPDENYRICSSISATQNPPLRSSLASSTEARDNNQSTASETLTTHFNAHNTKDGESMGGLQMCNRVKGSLDSSVMSSSVNLELSLGMPSWQIEHAHLSNELTLFMSRGH